MLTFLKIVHNVIRGLGFEKIGTSSRNGKIEEITYFHKTYHGFSLTINMKHMDRGGVSYDEMRSWDS